MLLGLVALPLTIGGCSALGLGGSSGGTASASPTPTGTPWIMYQSGSPTPSPTITFSGSRAAALPPVSFLALPSGACAQTFVQQDAALIPLTVVPAKGSLTVTWPRQYDSGYRITAVKQPVITGTQPPYAWQSVPAGTNCTVTATIKGLKSGVPYIVWLDAPNTGYERDGTRHLYSGASGVVYPL
jgi:hypothetical protein